MVATDIGWRPVVWTKRVPGNVEVCIRVHQGKRTTYCSGEQDISYWYTPSDVFEVRR